MEGIICFGLFMLFWPLVGTYVAHAKNRSQVEGAAFGCLLGPIGVIIAALLPTRERQQKKEPGYGWERWGQEELPPMRTKDIGEQDIEKWLDE
jgi:hypothetical protein